MRNLKPVFWVAAITIFIFILTKNPLTGFFKLQMLLIALIVLAGYSYKRKRSGEGVAKTKTSIYLTLVTVLLLVGATGWFFSPFFFSLYLSVILLAFIFPLNVSISFAITLVVLFAFNIGDVDLVYDFLIVLSLLTTIPLSIYLRKEYLKLKESEKEILILKKKEEFYKTKVEEVLSNTITNFAVNLKQPLNVVKQLIYRLPKAKSKKDKEKYVERIMNSSEEALRCLKKFEQESTGELLAVMPEKPIVSAQTASV